MSTIAAELPEDKERDERPDGGFLFLPEDGGEAGLPAKAKRLLAALDGTDSAPSLFSDEVIDKAAASAGAHFTARYLRERQPRIYRAIIALSAAGYSLREVADLLGVSKNTVAACIDDNPELLGTLKQRTARLLRRAGLKLAERLDEQADKLPLGQLAVTLGIVTDKAQLLEGEATAIVEQRSSPVHADWEATMRAIEAEYGSGDGNAVKSADARIVDDASGASLPPRSEPARDDGSDAFEGSASVSGSTATQSATDRAGNGPSDFNFDPAGGEGVETGNESSPAH